MGIIMDCIVVTLVVLMVSVELLIRWILGAA
jgi:hypothetical protein